MVSFSPFPTPLDAVVPVFLLVLDNCLRSLTSETLPVTWSRLRFDLTSETRISVCSELYKNSLHNSVQTGSQGEGGLYDQNSHSQMRLSRLKRAKMRFMARTIKKPTTLLQTPGLIKGHFAAQ